MGHLKASRRVRGAIHDGRAWLEPLHGGGACGSITTNRRTSVDGTALSKEFRILDAVEAQHQATERERFEHQPTAQRAESDLMLQREVDRRTSLHQG